MLLNKIMTSGWKVTVCVTKNESVPTNLMTIEGVINFMTSLSLYIYI